MVYVVCPCCHVGIELPANSTALDWFRVAVCNECDLTFDYRDEEVIEEPEPVVVGKFAC